MFLRVSRVAVPVAPDNQLAGWLFRIARNVALDHHRQRNRRPELSVHEACGPLLAPQRFGGIDAEAASGGTQRSDYTDE